MHQAEAPKEIVLPVPVGFGSHTARVATKKRDKMAWLASLVFTRECSLKKEWVQLSYQRLSKVLGTRYAKEIIERSINSNISVRNGFFKKGLTSFGYRIHDCLKDRGVAEHKVQDRVFLNRLRQIWMENEQSRRGTWHPIHFEMHRRLQQFDIDENLAYQAASSCISSDVDFDSSYNGQMIAIKRLKAKDDCVPLKVGTTGRVYTPICNMKKLVRYHLRAEGEKVSGFDIKASQPTFFGLLLKFMHNPENSFLSEPEVIERAKDYGVEIPAIPVGFCSNHEVQNYISLIEGSDIYDFLVDEYRKVNYYSMSRSDMKTSLLRDVFAKKGGYKSEVENGFRGCFPTVYHCVKQINKGNYTNLIRLLQFIESEVVIHRVFSSLIGSSDSPFAVLHDSIYAKRSDAKLVIDCFDSVSSDIGLGIRIDQESFEYKDALMDISPEMLKS